MAKKTFIQELSRPISRPAQSKEGFNYRKDLTPKYVVPMGTTHRLREFKSVKESPLKMTDEVMKNKEIKRGK